VIETPRPSGERVIQPRASRFDQPRWVMLRSLLVPGWGQLHNRAWLKALAVAGGEGLLAARMVDENRALERLSAAVDAARLEGDDVKERAAVDAYNRRLDRLIGREWLFAGLLSYALLDAYVDAHFRDFRIEFQHDPALPEGGGTPSGARAGLRWSF
jgi:hypothetical protein